MMPNSIVFRYGSCCWIIALSNMFLNWFVDFDPAISAVSLFQSFVILFDINCFLFSHFVNWGVSL